MYANPWVAHTYVGRRREERTDLVRRVERFLNGEWNVWVINDHDAAKEPARTIATLHGPGDVSLTYDGNHDPAVRSILNTIYWVVVDPAGPVHYDHPFTFRNQGPKHNHYGYKGEVMTPQHIVRVRVHQLHENVNENT